MRSPVQRREWRAMLALCCGNANTLERPAPIGGKAHDDGNIATAQQVPDGGDAEHAKPDSDKPSRIAATRRSTGTLMVIAPLPHYALM
jgi:hypothetical protein